MSLGRPCTSCQGYEYKVKVKIFPWKTTSHNGLIEVCLPAGIRLLSGRYGMWSSIKIPLGTSEKKSKKRDFGPKGR